MDRVTAKRVAPGLWVAVNTFTGRCVLGRDRLEALKIMQHQLKKQARKNSVS